ncbi:thiopeptide-type bacteriocin biosynthesis protein [Pedobacter caeni]|uniref:Thiopeptide-type bacteriocin biosynthesis domain-containing protein n=1 Tax=Pedobacter caeni TaxID=288992 RepID=A0A1M5EEV2_9SPHI|nr:thiopeptide-type bacteriocin biosynthesis protein [Pedobacter caeni]SHF77823.1 thiopeptide-type bacteriocin biosynthesis domain-containing protein [Pedobacter caeni]
MLKTNKIEIPEKFLLGQEWIYIKIYSGQITLDKFLCTELLEMVYEISHNKLIDKFFFIRYKDPEYHIRLRFHLTAQQHLNKVMDKINRIISSKVTDKVFWKVAIEPYEREMDRYGRYSINLVEQIFHNDSVNCLEVIKNQNFNIRWLFSIEICDFFFNNFNFNIEQKILFCRKTIVSFQEDYQLDKSTKIALDIKYRKYESDITKALTSPESLLIENYAKNIKEPCFKLNGLIDFYDKGSRASILASIIHMHFNRLLISDQRIKEFIIYYFMEKAYSSISARKKIHERQTI